MAGRPYCLRDLRHVKAGPAQKELFYSRPWPPAHQWIDRRQIVLSLKKGGLARPFRRALAQHRARDLGLARKERHGVGAVLGARGHFIQLWSTILALPFDLMNDSYFPFLALAVIPHPFARPFLHTHVFHDVCGLDYAVIPQDDARIKMWGIDGC